MTVVCGLQLGWVTSIAGMVESWLCAARHSTRVAGVGRVVEIQLDVWCWDAEIGRVVECSWMVVAGSCGWSVVGKSMFRYWHSVGMVKSWLLARNSESLRGLVVAMLGQSVTASRYVDWMLHCRSVVVSRSISRFWQYVGLTGGVSIWLLACNSESLRGPDDSVLV